MWLILTEPYDDTGTWLAEGLRPLTSEAVVHLTTRDLTQRARVCQVVADGESWFRVTVENGRTIDSRTLNGVVNRICALPPGLALRLHDPLRDSAQRNFGLPLLRMLHDVAGPVLNRPTAQGISGDFRLDFEWAALANQVGLPRAPARPAWPPARVPDRSHTNMSASDIVPVAVIGDQVLVLDNVDTRLPGNVIASCRRLAALSRTSLLGLDLMRSSPGEWKFLRANPRVNLVPGGAEVLTAVARALTVATVRPTVGKIQPPVATTLMALR
jgi:hypothetical protein